MPLHAGQPLPWQSWHSTSISADGSVNGKNDGRNRVLVVGAEEPVREVDQRGLEVHERDPLVHREPLDLREGGRVRGVERIVAVDHARNDHPDRRRRLHQRPDLHRRRVGAEQQAATRLALRRRGVEVERVVHVHRRVVRREVEREEVVPLGLHLGPDRDGEPELAEDLDDLVHDLGDRVLCTDPAMPGRHREVDAHEERIDTRRCRPLWTRMLSAFTLSSFSRAP